MNLIAAFLSIEKSAVGVATSWEKLKYANPVDVLNVTNIVQCSLENFEEL